MEGRGDAAHVGALVPGPEKWRIGGMGASFVVARNPDPESSLPYLLRIPLGEGVVLKARDRWPATARVYCHPLGEWPNEAEILEQVPVALCRKRGPAIDLVLDRPRENRSQFIFTEVKGRSAIFWQTRVAAMKANPGARIPRRKALTEGFKIAVDTRERYPFRFSGRAAVTERATLPAGDYGVKSGDAWLAVVERKSLEDFTNSLSNGSLAFQVQKLAELPMAAIAVEATYAALFEAPKAPEGWLPDMLARLTIRYREIPIVFAGSRKFAEEWTFRFLATALEDRDPAARVDGA